MMVIMTKAVPKGYDDDDDDDDDNGDRGLVLTLIDADNVCGDDG